MISLTCYSQSILKPDLVFSIDTPIIFSHYRDLLITEEFNNIKKEHVYDTIYSLNYGRNNKIKEETIKDLNFDRSIEKYEYDSLDRVNSTTQYTISRLKEKFLLTTIRKSLFFYNGFDSISHIEWYKCERKRKDDVIKMEQEKVNNSKTIEEAFENLQQNYSDYTNIWVWSFDSRVDHFYNSKHNRIMTMINTREYGLDSKWIYKYDDLNRKSEETYCNYSFKPDFTRDTNSCQFLNKKHFFYDNSLCTVIDTNYSGETYIITKTKVVINQQGKINSIFETWEREDRKGNLLKDKDNEGYKETKYFYDSKDRIIKRTEFSNGCSDTTRFVYIYKK